MGMRLQYPSYAVGRGAGVLPRRDRRRTDGVRPDQHTCNGSGSGTVCLRPATFRSNNSRPMLRTPRRHMAD